ncbi:Benzene 1,2-dioxygenase system ferredoxin--NAD(+) reductase subunit [Actinobaculum suis]|uniref:Benzene 1,2-dioxygenase system ferredoxin--NAD(+) reductase subunit n=1 Tax=Actinobaculum suis TaxID=1657 RepID=A0A7Z8Y8D5_9ACTO|nr:FAD-dependent oxidoreductase [Actinobaculum suis]VDG76074.1 Benzene 1,2-dioxygenase system ferredoxin--NAD(+) reductase subunit [Actinobaculum suis]
MRIGIIGTGIAGLRTAAELRENGFAGEILAWDLERCPPYDRPPLSKNLFTDFTHLLAADGLGDFAALGVTVISDPADRVWRHDELLERFEDRWHIESAAPEEIVDAVVIASGTQPLMTLPNALPLYTARDAHSLRARITPQSVVHIAGSGWLGTELAATIAAFGAHVELWGRSGHFLGANLGAQVDELWQGWCARAGVVWHPEAYPQKLWRGKPAFAEPDVLVEASGSRPALGFVREPVAFSPRGALVVDVRGRVLAPNGDPIPGLFAAGDACDTYLPRQVASEVSDNVPGDTPDLATRNTAYTSTGNPAFPGTSNPARTGTAAGTFAGNNSTRTVTGNAARKFMDTRELLLGGHWRSALASAQRVAATICGLPGPEWLPAPEAFSTQFGHEIALLGSWEKISAAASSPTVTETATGQVFTWYDAAHPSRPQAVLTVDSPRETSRARRQLRIPVPPAARQ